MAPKTLTFSGELVTRIEKALAPLGNKKEFKQHVTDALHLYEWYAGKLNGGSKLAIICPDGSLREIIFHWDSVCSQCGNTRTVMHGMGQVGACPSCLEHD